MCRQKPTRSPRLRPWNAAAEFRKQLLQPVHMHTAPAAVDVNDAHLGLQTYSLRFNNACTPRFTEPFAFPWHKLWVRSVDWARACTHDGLSTPHDKTEWWAEDYCDGEVLTMYACLYSCKQSKLTTASGCEPWSAALSKAYWVELNSVLMRWCHLDNYSARLYL